MVRKWLWFNSLALVLFGCFVVFVVAQAYFGWQVRNDDLQQAGLAADSFGHYLGSGHFGEAVFENWESEFLQMGSYVLLTAYLVQRGSPESKPLERKDRSDDYPGGAGPDSPAPSRRPGVGQFLYRNSLAIAFLGMFLLSFVLHLATGTAAYNEEQRLQSGAAPISVGRFFVTAQFWFQSMQNWQSEFLSVGALVILTVFLRQRGSPESKPVDESITTTGS